MLINLKEEIDLRKLNIKKKKVLQIVNGTDKTIKKIELHKIFYMNKKTK